MNSKIFVEKIKEYIDQLELNNEPIDCVFVNPKDYDNHIMPSGKASVNYDAPYFGSIDPIRFYGIIIIVSRDVPEGTFHKVNNKQPIYSVTG